MIKKERYQTQDEGRMKHHIPVSEISQSAPIASTLP